MADARSEILSRIRKALRDAPSVALPPAGPVPEAGAYREALARDLPFVREAEAVGVRVHRATREDLPEVVVEILRACGARRVALSEEWEGLGERLREAGFAVGGPQTAQEADAGITGAAFGLAETGTLVVPSRGGGRVTSLLPPVHVAILGEDRILPDLDALFARIRTEELPAAVTLITGPSRTADIEQTLTPGVHGPGTVHVVLVRDIDRREEP